MKTKILLPSKITTDIEELHRADHSDKRGIDELFIIMRLLTLQQSRFRNKDNAISEHTPPPLIVGPANLTNSDQ